MTSAMIVSGTAKRTDQPRPRRPGTSVSAGRPSRPRSTVPTGNASDCWTKSSRSSASTSPNAKDMYRAYRVSTVCASRNTAIARIVLSTVDTVVPSETASTRLPISLGAASPATTAASEWRPTVRRAHADDDEPPDARSAGPRASATGSISLIGSSPRATILRYRSSSMRSRCLPTATTCPRCISATWSARSSNSGLAVVTTVVRSGAR